MLKPTLVAMGLAILLPVTSFAGAGHRHGAKPAQGGVMAQAMDIDYELVAREASLSLFAYDHGKPLALSGGKAVATVHGRNEKTRVELKPAGEQKLVAEGRFATGLGVRVAVELELPGKPPATLNFRLK